MEIKLPILTFAQCFPNINLTEVELLNEDARIAGTSITKEECRIICALIKHYQPHRILEIGTYQGNTTLNMAYNSPDDAQVVTIDLPMYNTQKPVAGGLGSQFRGHKLASKIIQLYAESQHFNWNEIGSFSFIFIDGSHDCDVVLKDTQNALKHSNEKSIIVWHDYGVYSGVTSIVEEIVLPYNDINVFMIDKTSLAVATKL